MVKPLLNVTYRTTIHSTSTRMPKLEPLVKNATQKISDPEARGVAEKAYKTLQKAAGEGAQSLQQVTSEAAKKQVGPGLENCGAKSLVKIVLQKWFILTIWKTF